MGIPDMSTALLYGDEVTKYHKPGYYHFFDNVVVEIKDHTRLRSNTEPSYAEKKAAKRLKFREKVKSLEPNMKTIKKGYWRPGMGAHNRNSDLIYCLVKKSDFDTIYYLLDHQRSFIVLPDDYDSK